MRELSFSLPIGTTPEQVEDQATNIELYKIYNAVNLLAFLLDSYTGAAPVAQGDRATVPVSQSSRLAQVNSGYAEAAVTLLAGDLVHFDSTGKMVKAQSTGTHLLKCQALVLEDTPSGTYGKYILSGVTTVISGLTPGAYYFLSTAAGFLGAGAPAAGNTLQYLGFAISSSQFYFNPEPRHSVA